MTDLLSGDEAITHRPEFSELTHEEFAEALALILNSPLSDRRKQFLLANSWKIHYRSKPPSIEEFLTEKWIGPTADSIYPHVRQWLTDYWQPNSIKRHFLLATAIGTGKSFASTISSLYVTTHLWAMRNPKKYFGLSQATSIVHALISFTMEKAQQLLLQPFNQILISSDKFHRVRQEERLTAKQLEYPDKICWTSAGKIGVMQFDNDIHYMLASSPQKLLGLNMISAILSEISFFLDQGFSAEYIWRIYQDSKARVRSRFEDKFFSGTIIDSSPNDMEESPIDRYIFSGEAEKDPTNYVVTGSQWEFLPHKFQEWHRTGKTFSVFRGNSAHAAKILSKEEPIDQFAPGEVIEVPIDVKQFFEDNLTKNIKDYAGWPSGSDDKLLRDYDSLERMFTPQLKNLYKFIYAPANVSPDQLIWSQIVNQFFIKHKENNYEFYRAPLEKRYLHIDQSESGDLTGISCVHPEMNTEGTVVYITDFNIAITPGKNRINLGAIESFLFDLRDKGRLDIGLITFDMFQSTTSMQKLAYYDFEVKRLSVDRDKNIYLMYVSLLRNDRIRAGRNIILKNNIKSLQEASTPSGKKKIDHLKGKPILEDDGLWSTSLMGMWAKDLSDSHCGAVWNAIQDYKGVPKYQWEDLATESFVDLTPEETVEAFNEATKSKIFKYMESKYSLQKRV